MIFVGIDVANCSDTREDKRRAGQEKTRGGQDPVMRVQGWPEDKRRTRGGPISVANQCGQLFFSPRENPNSKLLGE